MRSHLVIRDRGGSEEEEEEEEEDFCCLLFAVCPRRLASSCAMARVFEGEGEGASEG